MMYKEECVHHSVCAKISQIHHHDWLLWLPSERYKFFCYSRPRENTPPLHITRRGHHFRSSLILVWIVPTDPNPVVPVSMERKNQETTVCVCVHRFPASHSSAKKYAKNIVVFLFLQVPGLPPHQVHSEACTRRLTRKGQRGPFNQWNF